MELNPVVLASAFKSALAKNAKIKLLGIKPDTTEDEVNTLIEILAKEKAEKEGGKWESYVKGQRWYVEHLVAFSALDSKERLDAEYQQQFPNGASYDEMLAVLEASI